MKEKRHARIDSEERAMMESKECQRARIKRQKRDQDGKQSERERATMKRKERERSRMESKEICREQR